MDVPLSKDATLGTLTQVAREEKEASSGNEEDNAEAAAAVGAADGTLSLHNTFMDVVVRYVHSFIYLCLRGHRPLP